MMVYTTTTSRHLQHYSRFAQTNCSARSSAGNAQISLDPSAPLHLEFSLRHCPKDNAPRTVTQTTWPQRVARNSGPHQSRAKLKQCHRLLQWRLNVGVEHLFSTRETETSRERQTDRPETETKKRQEKEVAIGRQTKIQPTNRLPE